MHIVKPVHAITSIKHTTSIFFKYYLSIRSDKNGLNVTQIITIHTYALLKKSLDKPVVESYTLDIRQITYIF
jgi:hypothetical protein